jgi:hypothetical protein
MKEEIINRGFFKISYQRGSKVTQTEICYMTLELAGVINLEKLKPFLY